MNRRGFLKVGVLCTASLAFRPPPQWPRQSLEALARVAAAQVGVYQEPSFRSSLQGRLQRDEILTLMDRVKADEGPAHNPLWYRIPGGYAHSGDLQVVRWELQKPRSSLPTPGAVLEVSVPYTRTYRKPDPTSEPLYRLYYKSTAWGVDCALGADGRRWYELRDDLLGVHYFARSEHLRLVPKTELTPLSTEVPSEAKRIEVDLAQQELRAYEYERLVLRTQISSGIHNPKPGDNGIPTITPSGNFYVTRKMPLRHMGDGNLTADLGAYELPGVPWCSFFHQTGVAFHGTYWHTDFGRPRSHGCVNMRTEEAKWLYRWTSPTVPPDEILRTGYGTPVTVR
jgi:hypothetical protein